MAGIKRSERLQIMLDDDELKAIDDWRFSKRMPSRASAVRELLRHGLAAVGVSVAATGAKSKDYSVVATSSNGTLAKSSRVYPPAGQNGTAKKGSA